MAITNTNNDFYSALALSEAAYFSGNLPMTRQNLKNTLQGMGIDTGPAVSNLPPGANGDREAVARLVSLARGNGYCVQLLGRKSDNSLDINIVLPTTVNMLQSGHHQGDINV